MSLYRIVPILLLVLAGSAASGEMIRLECPGCGITSGDMLTGVGKWMNQARSVYWDPEENRFVDMVLFAGKAFEEEQGIEQEDAFYMGGGDQWELWEEYLLFFDAIIWPDTIRFPEDLSHFEPNLPEFSTEAFFVRVAEPNLCPLCDMEMLVHRVGAWD